MSAIRDVCLKAVGRKIWYRGTNGNEYDPIHHGFPISGYGLCVEEHDSHGLCIIVEEQHEDKYDWDKFITTNVCVDPEEVLIEAKAGEKGILKRTHGPLLIFESLLGEIFIKCSADRVAQQWLNEFRGRLAIIQSEHQTTLGKDIEVCVFVPHDSGWKVETQGEGMGGCPYIVKYEQGTARFLGPDGKTYTMPPLYGSVRDAYTVLLETTKCPT